MSYVDGFVLVVPTKNLPAYFRMSRNAGKIWREYGALEYKECVGDDLETPMGLAFTRLTKAKADETVVFSYIVYKSRAQRDRINAKVMKDPRIEDLCGGSEMPFNPKRMAYGGFKVVVSA